MYIFKNALKNISRNKGRNLLVGCILLAIITTTAIAFTINETTEEIIKDYKNRFGTEALIMPDYKMLEEEGPNYNFENITVGQYKEMAKSSALKEYKLSTDVAVVGTKIKAIDEGKEDNSLMQSVMMDEKGNLIESKSPTMRILASTDKELPSEFKEGSREIIEGTAYGNDGDCIISEQLAKENNLKVGDSIELESVNDVKGEKLSLKISGIYKDLTKEYRDAFRSPSMNRRNEILVSFDTIEKLELKNNFIMPKFILKSPEHLEEFQKDLEKAKVSNIYKVTIDKAGYEKIIAPVEGLTKITSMFMFTIFILGGGILIVLTTIAIRERKYEVGVLRAMGMKKIKIATGFLLENVILTIMSLVIGISISIALVQPVTDSLLKNQIEIVENQKNNQIGMSMAIASPIEEDKPAEIKNIKVSLGIDVIMKIMAVSIVLIIISSLTSIIFIMKHEPMKILSERN